MPTYIGNHLADGLWAYALAFTFFIIWEKFPPKPWLVGLILLPLVYEFLQYKKIFAGVADIADVAVYYFFIALAFIHFYFIKNKSYKYETSSF